MKISRKTEKRCRLCKRIITDPNNKTGICRKCQKIAKTAGSGVALAGVVMTVKFLPKLIKEGIRMLKK